MNHLLTTIIFIAVFVSASADMTGLWIRDWQSVSVGDCQPTYITINEVSQGTYNVSYNYTASDLVACTVNITYASSLTQNATTGAWVDSVGAQLTYSSNITDGIITYFLGDAYFPILFDRNGAVIPEATGLGLVGGVWNNPTLINATNASACCVPANLYIEPQSGILYPEGEIYVTYNYVNSTCGGGNSSKAENLSIDRALINLLNWTGADMTFLATVNVILDPSSSSNQLTVEYQYPNLTNFSDPNPENTCFYSYQRSQPQLINGTWLPDWQNYYYTGPSSYQISIVNDTYMISTLNYSNGNSKTGAIAVNNANQYYDSVLDATFEYDKTTGSLLTVQSLTGTLLFTKNGSLLSDNMYAANWNNSQSLNANATCCLPEFLEIGASHTTPNMYAIAYFFPSNYTDNEACNQIASYFVGDYEFLMTLETSPPSFTNLNWVDNYGSKYTFAGNDTSPQLVVSNFTGSGCNFTMSYTTDPNPPNPSPLSSGWMGIDIKFIVIVTISMIFACL